MANVYETLFTRGTAKALESTAISDGKIRFCTDTQQLFIDYATSRIEITDFVSGYTEKQIKELANPLSNKFYLASDTEVIMYYKNSEWHYLSCSDAATLQGHPASYFATADHTHTEYLETSLKGAANGLAELDGTGKVPASQLPSYVDDIIEGYYYNKNFYEDSEHTILITPESGKIYVDLATNKSYRWGGTEYVEICSSLSLGETSSTAYRGDRGKIAYDHSQLTSGNPHNVTKADVGLSNVTNDRQVKAPESVTAGHVAVFGGDGSIITDAGHTVAKDVPDDAEFTDTKITAGITAADNTKLLLIGAAGNSNDLYEETFTNDKVYIGTDNMLYSNEQQVVTVNATQNLTNKTYNGYTLADAAARGVDSTATEDSTNLIESGAVYDIEHPEFTEAATKENINSGESLSTLFGKIKKWFSSLGALAFKSKVTSEDLDPLLEIDCGCDD